MTAAAVTDAVVRWAVHAVGTVGAVGTALAGPAVTVEPLRSGGHPLLLRVGADEVVLKTGADLSAELATEAAALGVCERHGLPAPRLLAADLTGDEAGAPAIVLSVLEGSASIPVRPSSERWRALGAAAAAIHRVTLTPSAVLPVRARHMPWIDLSAERRRGDAPTTPLLDAADALLAGRSGIEEPEETTASFVHGDLWSGNTLWSGDAYVGTIDWEAAGAGHPGVDVGSLRFDAALVHDADAADHVLAGWRQASDDGHDLDDGEVAYWDVVAAANTPPDMTPFTPAFRDAGRGDLTGPDLTARRDRFLERALHRLS